MSPLELREEILTLFAEMEEVEAEEESNDLDFGDEFTNAIFEDR